MRVFISWSGDRSRRVAELLKDWLKTVVQASKPWISTGIERGALWAGEIGGVLSETNVGILCITAENVNAPWVLFEAGALAKGLPQSRVIPLLIDIAPSDLRMPLSQFNATGCDREGMRQLVHTVNLATVDPLEGPIVEASIDAHWDRFSQSLAEILNHTDDAAPAPPRRDGDKLDEVLSMMHGLASRIQQIERRSMELLTPSDVIRSMKLNGATPAEISGVINQYGWGPSVLPATIRATWPKTLLGGALGGDSGGVGGAESE